MYSRDDLLDYSETLGTHIKGHVQQDFSSLINMSALAITGLLEEAQDQNVSLSVNMLSLENQGLLDTIEKMSIEAPSAAKRRGVVELVRKMIAFIVIELLLLSSLACLYVCMLLHV